MRTRNQSWMSRNRLGLWWLCAAALLSLMLLASCGPPAPVVQGKVVAVEEGGRSISVQDETRPDAPAIKLDISSAEIGATPVEGDQVRIVYNQRGETNVALRVMNITRQKARESSGH
jgi:hypothetical protein